LTIVRVQENGVTILRPGSISAADISDCAGLKIANIDENSGIVAPGMMQSHYAPRSQLNTDCRLPEGDAVMLAFGDMTGHRNLSPSGDLREAASNLYRYIRELDDMGKEKICVAPIPHRGLGIAINDRLSRAAAPRNLNGEQ